MNQAIIDEIIRLVALKGSYAQDSELIKSFEKVLTKLEDSDISTVWAVLTGLYYHPNTKKYVPFKKE